MDYKLSLSAEIEERFEKAFNECISKAKSGLLEPNSNCSKVKPHAATKNRSFNIERHHDISRSCRKLNKSLPETTTDDLQPSFRIRKRKYSVISDLDVDSYHGGECQNGLSNKEKTDLQPKISRELPERPESRLKRARISNPVILPEQRPQKGPYSEQRPQKGPYSEQRPQKGQYSEQRPQKGPYSDKDIVRNQHGVLKQPIDREHLPVCYFTEHCISSAAVTSDRPLLNGISSVAVTSDRPLLNGIHHFDLCEKNRCGSGDNYTFKKKKKSPKSPKERHDWNSRSCSEKMVNVDSEFRNTSRILSDRKGLKVSDYTSNHLILSENSEDEPCCQQRQRVNYKDEIVRLKDEDRTMDQRVEQKELTDNGMNVSATSLRTDVGYCSSVFNSVSLRKQSVLNSCHGDFKSLQLKKDRSAPERHCCSLEDHFSHDSNCDVSVSSIKSSELDLVPSRRQRQNKVLTTGYSSIPARVVMNEVTDIQKLQHICDLQSSKSRRQHYSVAGERLQSDCDNAICKTISRTAVSSEEGHNIKRSSKIDSRMSVPADKYVSFESQQFLPSQNCKNRLNADGCNELRASPLEENTQSVLRTSPLEENTQSVGREVTLSELEAMIPLDTNHCDFINIPQRLRHTEKSKVSMRRHSEGAIWTTILSSFD